MVHVVQEEILSEMTQSCHCIADMICRYENDLAEIESNIQLLMRKVILVSEHSPSMVKPSSTDVDD